MFLCPLYLKKSITHLLLFDTMGNNLFLIPKTDSVPSRRHWKSIPLSARVFLFILLCSVGMLRAADNYAQNILLRIHASEQRVSDVLAQIEAQSEFDFFFNDDHVDLAVSYPSMPTAATSSPSSTNFLRGRMSITPCAARKSFSPPPFLRRKLSSRLWKCVAAWWTPTASPSSAPLSWRPIRATASSPTWTATSCCVCRLPVPPSASATWAM